jgi:hypothetical protein
VHNKVFGELVLGGGSWGREVVELSGQKVGGWEATRSAATGLSNDKYISPQFSEFAFILVRYDRYCVTL